ncbi:MAG: hypothetical protein QM751_12920 [Paludibacteraceae bacterium]
MLSSPQDALSYLRLNDLQHFVVTLKDADNAKVFETRENESFEDAAKRFIDVMQLSRGGLYYLKGRKDFKSLKGNFYEQFRNIESTTPEHNTISGVPTPSLGFVSPDELERRLQNEREKIMSAVKIERLEAELKEAKGEINSHNTMLNSVMKRAEPYVGTILGGLLNKIMPHTAVAVAGTDREIDDFNPDYCDSESDITNVARLENALKRFSAAEPDFLKILETLAYMAERQDSMYLIAKQQLLK